MKKRIAELEAEVKKQDGNILQLKASKTATTAVEESGPPVAQHVALATTTENQSSSAAVETKDAAARVVAKSQEPVKIAAFSDHD